jgi:hypothetical protein
MPLRNHIFIMAFFVILICRDPVTLPVAQEAAKEPDDG